MHKSLCVKMFRHVFTWCRMSWRSSSPDGLNKRKRQSSSRSSEQLNHQTSASNHITHPGTLVTLKRQKKLPDLHWNRVISREQKIVAKSAPSFDDKIKFILNSSPSSSSKQLSHTPPPVRPATLRLPATQNKTSRGIAIRTHTLPHCPWPWPLTPEAQRRTAVSFCRSVEACRCHTSGM